MKRIVILSPVLFLLYVSCSKNSYTTKPQISIESINTTIAHDGQLNAMLKFTDKQGDLGGGTFTAIIVSLNQQPPINALIDTLPETVPSFPNHSLGEFQYTLDASRLEQHTTQNDTLKMRFCVVDRAGNASDTITSPLIVVLNP
jgi:hypothetical protein